MKSIESNNNSELHPKRFIQSDLLQETEVEKELEFSLVIMEPRRGYLPVLCCAILANALGKWIRDSESGSEASAEGFDAENEQVLRRIVRYA